MASDLTLTIKLRLRDKHAAELTRQARSVNFVWNYCNETQQKAARDGRKWLTGFDLQRLTSGTSKDLGLLARTICQVCTTYFNSRRSHKKPWLRWRGKKSLGWVPFNTGDISFNGETFLFHQVVYGVMNLHPSLGAGAKIGAGSFNQDSRGRWYLNASIVMKCASSPSVRAVGIDLGLKTLATLSTGETIVAPQFYRASERRLAVAQRAKRPARVRRIYAKVANRRKDFLHKASAAVAREYGLIAIGDVSPSRLAQTKMAKSVLDAGWSGFKHMLSYKAVMHGGCFIEVSERMTTQTCSECGCTPPSRPKGIAGLGIREWSCDDCGAVHDRDVNAAKNILRVGQDALAEGARYLGSCQVQPSPSSITEIH